MRGRVAGLVTSFNYRVWERWFDRDWLPEKVWAWGSALFDEVASALCTHTATRSYSDGEVHCGGCGLWWNERDV